MFRFVADIVLYSKQASLSFLSFNPLAGLRIVLACTSLLPVSIYSIKRGSPVCKILITIVVAVVTAHLMSQLTNTCTAATLTEHRGYIRWDRDRSLTPR